MLKTKTIAGGHNGPRLLITGGVHGDEFEPMAAIFRLMDAIAPETLNGTVTLVPIVNEAAFFRGTRTAADELDLARVCPGNANGSITERTACALAQLITQADFYIDLHSGGVAFRVLPLSGYILHPDDGVLEAQRRMARAFNLPIVWGTSFLPGRSLSVAYMARVPAIYAEYQGGGGCDPAGVAAYVAGCLNVMSQCEMLPPRTINSIVELVVEDPRPESGHMQVQNPAPTSGFFEPAVALGDRIAIGQPLGTICDPSGATRQTVHARQNGIVLVLRSFRRVATGESLGVILEADRGLPARSGWESDAGKASLNG